MNYSKIEWLDLGVTAEVGTFAPKAGVPEWHVMLHVEAQGRQFPAQLSSIRAAEARLCSSLAASEAAIGGNVSIVMKRYFLSDATNQVPLMKQEGKGERAEASVSYIQQPPLDGSKIAVWLYIQSGTTVSEEDGAVVADHNGYRHLWRMGMVHPDGNSYFQTEKVLTEYEALLRSHGATLADNCIRTWFFVRDVDTQYAGMVKARLANFFNEGLTAKTHYIASTGIQGMPADTNAIIQLGAYAITGIQPEQQRYLYALDHLNRTIEYGVTFERGVVVEYGDRAHAYISGTASINDKGEVVHVGDIVHQTERMWENVEALLSEAQMTMDDCAQIIVYLRDTADYATVRQMFAERYPDIPTVFTLAPVCRPTWLIEMECVGIAERINPQYRKF